MKGYKAVLFAPDGDWVTDFKRYTKEEVMEQLADRGSRWLFYPLEAIIYDRGVATSGRQRIVDAPVPLNKCIGETIKAVSRIIANTELTTILYGKED